MSSAGIMVAVVVVVCFITITAYACSWFFANRATLLQRKIRSTLRAVMGKLNDAQIPFTLAHGTLLGYVRENDVIRGDNDGDLAVTWRDAERVAQLARSDRRFCVHRIKGHPDRIQFINFRESLLSIAHVDITVIYPHESKVAGKGRSLTQSNHCKVDDWGRPCDWRAVTFLGHRAATPPDPHTFLVSAYGADYMTPRPLYKGLNDRCDVSAYRDFCKRYFATFHDTD